MKFDEWQLKSIENEDEKVLLIAPPGSGKTTVLIRKIQYMAEKGMDPERILCLTFSRAGAMNMKERYMKVSERSPKFGTVHSFCFKALGKKGRSKVITDGEKLRAFNEFRERYLLKQDEVERLIGQISLRRSEIQKIESAEFPDYMIKEAMEEYEEFKRKGGYTDFDDMEEGFLKQIEDVAFLENLKKDFDAVLVDEFQDLNDVQLKIIRKISEGKKLFCVGDEDQCIYAFRGSNTEAMVDFESYFPGGRKLYLIYNYRSSKTVIDHANSVIEKNRKRNDKRIVNFRQDESILRVLHTDDESDSCERIMELIGKSGSDRTFGILARTNAELGDIHKKLLIEDVPFSVLDEPYNMMETSVIKDIYAFLRFLSFGYKEDLIHILKKLGIVSSWDLMKIDPSLDGRKTIDDLLFSLDDHESILKLKKLKDDMKRCIKLPPYALVDYILYVFGYVDHLEKKALLYGRSIHEYIKEAERFREFLRGFLALDDLHEFRRRYDMVMKVRGYPMERIVTSTIHSTKGMEFDTVFILNCIRGHIPHARSDDDEAERRLFYVGITRTKHDLYLVCPKKYGKIRTEISQYLG